jgi:hypothetical protein
MLANLAVEVAQPSDVKASSEYVGRRMQHLSHYYCVVYHTPPVLELSIPLEEGPH